MQSDIWSLFPFSTATQTTLIDGSLQPVHPDCKACSTKPCIATASDTVSVCRRGLGNIRIDDERVAVGLIASGLPSTPPRLKRRFARERERVVKAKDVKEAVDKVHSLDPSLVNDATTRKAAILDALKEDEDLQHAIAEHFREEHTTTLNQSHDFLQLTNLVSGYAESLLHARHPDLTPEDAAEKCPEEGAIYFATRLMRMKMDSLTYLSEMNRAFGLETTFSLHPFALKYVRIYNWQANQKGLNLRLVNECHAKIRYNNDAVGALLQGLLDNMVKYAPASSDAAIVFDVRERAVHVSFTSLGPKIEEDEYKQIFMPKYRGKAAREFESEGQGIGLAVVKQISNALDLDIEVIQDPLPNPKFGDYFNTVFRVRFAIA